MAEVLNTRGHCLTQISAAIVWAIKTNQEPLVARRTHLAIPDTAHVHSNIETAIFKITLVLIRACDVVYSHPQLETHSCLQDW